MSNSSNIVLTILVMLFLYNCAHQVAPTGGEEDEIPPEIVEFYPANGTTNFSDNYIEITFSEYVQKSSVREAVFISPKIKGELEYSWSGKSLEIEFNDTLKPNTTYTVTVGTDIQDYNNRNNMAEARTFVFSTGNKIDRGEISGKVYDDKPIGVMIYAYKELDSLVNPLNQEPDYVSQVGDNGKYSIRGLGNGQYLVLAIRDDFRNYLYNVGEDDYGVPRQKIILTDSDSSFNGIDFRLTREDTIPPNILSVTMTDEAHLLVEFSEFVDSTKINPDFFFVYDSTAANKHDLIYFYKGTAKQKNIFVTLKDSLIAENENYLVCGKLFDLAGNISENLSTSFVINDIPDTVEAKLINISTEFENKIMDHENAWFQATLNDGISTSNLENVVTLSLKGEPIPVDINVIDDAAFFARVVKPLKDNKEYELKIDLSNFIDTKGNRKDTVYTVVLKTKNKLDYSGVSGKVNNKDSTAAMLNLVNTEGSKKTYYTFVDEKGKYNFPRVVPGKYVLWAFADIDSDSTYNYGTIYPFGPSEKFIYYPDTLDLKPRWPVGDVEIDF